MIAEFIRISCATFFVLLYFCEPSFSITEEEAAQQWNAVRGTAKESTILINLFQNGKIPGNFLHTVKERFYEIATPEDAAILLKIWTDPELRRKNAFTLPLLKGLKGDEFTSLIEEYLYVAYDQRNQNRLYHMLVKQDSPLAFKAAITFINHLYDSGLYKEAIFYISPMSSFKNPVLRQEIISQTNSDSSITRAACYTALRNYQDDTVLEIINEALQSDNGSLKGEEDKALPERHINSGEAGKGLIKDILNSTKFYIEQERKLNKESKDKQKTGDFIPEELIHLVSISHAESAVSASSTDEELGIAYAPHFFLSYGEPPGVYLKDENYPYADYIPMYVNNVTRLDKKTAWLHLTEEVTYQGTSYGPGNIELGTLNYIGATAFRESADYLDFSPAWSLFGTVADGYKDLTIYESVYYKVFRDASRKYPIAVQYWFFYYYNDWSIFDHQGDWETISVFLNTDAQPQEVIYSTHYEANRHSWAYIDVVNNTHPIVYVSNGGHGSYSWEGKTSYSWASIDDNHDGDEQELTPSNYYLLPLSTEEATVDSWIWFKGRWGYDSGSPSGPRLRTDTPTEQLWNYANNKPYNPEKNCAPRYGEDAANIYGTDDNPGPWFWASGYGIDTPWESASDCRYDNSTPPLTSVLHLLLLRQPAVTSASAVEKTNTSRK